MNPVRLAELAAVGPFFALRTEDPPEGAPGGPGEPGYLRLAGPAVRLRVDTVARRLATGDRRAAASIAFQGIAGRLLSLALGSAVLTGSVPDLTADGPWWHPERTAPDDLWLPRPAALPLAGDGAEEITATVLDGTLPRLHTAFRAEVPISSRLLWGNAGSALAGAARVLHGWCAGQGRTADAARTLALTRSLLARPPLRGTGTLGPAGEFTRRTCCLYYRVPAGGKCGDCVLRHPPAQRPTAAI
ncbi:(2Fe-2S)-binding protein [Streptomyces orinoci]|uniref:(2Fe-2S)-binding protein n=1 Tax=Streptomyces orinoci TaxID=67339 RepID=A0ABV3JS10_STRON|nr:(2Fe-2S)-binding protein [Streptomyces orinoci]